MIRISASDLHIGVGVPPAMRVDGGLKYIEESGILTGFDVEQALKTILTSEQMETYKEVHELDFSFTYKTDNLEARFRGNCYYESRNMAAAFRLIPLQIRSIDDLSLPPVLKDISKRRRGLFLVTGPTGHGK
ncbi:MAG: type IV pili twitching motility protein PilT, partial [Synergistaceae bacterium]|nr:type IV pili twitching motility protein PilT [Synergistaceae bacterium]